jgi:hypothetical protein
MRQFPRESAALSAVNAAQSMTEAHTFGRNVPINGCFIEDASMSAREASTPNQVTSANPPKLQFRVHFSFGDPTCAFKMDCNAS